MSSAFENFVDIVLASLIGSEGKTHFVVTAIVRNQPVIIDAVVF